ncbi:MAG: murein L,D-transpeptidase [Armatimonadetes bacterium]|nr:murein L,D-transpeptidase [Armatimonadota bacterium]
MITMVVSTFTYKFAVAFLASVLMICGGSVYLWEHSLYGPMPSSGAVVDTARPELWVRTLIPGGRPEIILDGELLKTERLKNTLIFFATARRLADGEHQAMASLWPPWSTLQPARLSWSFAVDTVAPQLKLDFPKKKHLTSESQIQVIGRTDHDARVVIRCGAAQEQAAVSPSGRIRRSVALESGENIVEIEAVDPGGNRTVRVTTVVCDPDPPSVIPLSPAPGSVAHEESVKIAARVSDRGSGLSALFLQVDDARPIPVSLPKKGDNVTVSLSHLPQGERRITLRAVDKAGGEAPSMWRFVVDNTEVLGREILTRGALGADVKRMQKRLVALGYLDPGGVTGKFDDPTEDAVKWLQQASRLKPDGRVEGKTIAALSPRMYINLSKFSLALVEGPDTYKIFPIACGSPAYPTPVGTFQVTDLILNPTWFPPKSPWAKEAQITPPGPGNPLGTRWIGLNSSVVGIHGTYSDWSIGYPVSHGCIRMRVRDVEEIFNRVNVGTEVVILSGWEKSPVLDLYWPPTKKKP